MATIQARQRKDGTKSYTVTIRIKAKGKTVHTESRTFSRLALAEDWGKRREVQLENPGALLRATQGETRLGTLVDWYVEEFEAISEWQRSKGQHLRQISRMKIADIDALELTVPILMDHVRDRRRTAGPATVANDLVWLGVVLRAAKSVKGIPVVPEVVDEAREACRALRLIGKSRPRNRTPTYEELQRLDEFFERQDKGKGIQVPMRQVMWFAIYSARREAEICMLLRKDNEEDRKLGLVRDAKHPDSKMGNHRPFRYTPQAWAIMKMQPKSKDGRLFPYNPNTVSNRFTDACVLLGIDDLHFHDLRHEATTRLFEQSLTIPEVAAHTLHESWAVLKRYTHLVKRGEVFHAPFLAGKPDAPVSPAKRTLWV